MSDSRSLKYPRPILVVSRPVAACNRCRNGKIRCDQKLPACTACIKANKAEQCAEFADDEFVKGKQRSYVVALETEIKELEAQLLRARSRQEAAEIPTTEQELSLSGASYDGVHHSLDSKAERQRDTDDVDDLVADFGSMSVNATFLDPDKPSSLTFARLIMCTATAEKERMPAFDRHNLPTELNANRLIRHYLSHFHCLYPAFNETTLWSASAAVYTRRPTAYQSWLFFMTLAISSSSQSSTANDQNYKTGVEYVAHALHYANEVLLPHLATQLPALVLLIEYSLLDPTHFDSWQLIGYACRSLVELGYHLDPPKDHTLTKDDLNRRRQLFFCIFSLDRLISMTLSKPFSFTDDATAVVLPTAPSTASILKDDGWRQVAVSLFQFRKMESAWYQALHQTLQDRTEEDDAYIWQACSDMRHWMANIPATVPQEIQRLFKLEFLYSHVYCLTPVNAGFVLSDYAKQLIIQNGIEYVELFCHSYDNPVMASFYTSVDVRRLHFIGHHLLGILRSQENVDRLLSGVPPQWSPIEGLAPPPLSSSAPQLSAAILTSCVEQIEETLNRSSQRWREFEAFATMFSEQAEPILSDLISRSTTVPVGDLYQSPYSDYRHNSDVSQLSQFLPSDGYTNLPETPLQWNMSPGDFSTSAEQIFDYGNHSYGTASSPYDVAGNVSQRPQLVNQSSSYDSNRPLSVYDSNSYRAASSPYEVPGSASQRPQLVNHGSSYDNGRPRAQLSPHNSYDATVSSQSSGIPPTNYYGQSSPPSQFHR